MAEWLGGLGPCDPEGDEERRDATANGTDPTTEGSCERLCFVEICRPERCYQADEDHDRDELRQQRTQRETDPAEGHFLGTLPSDRAGAKEIPTTSPVARALHKRLNSDSARR
jgi:hypothetical protein